MSATYLEVTEDYEKYSGKRNGVVYLKKGEIVFAKSYSPIIDATYIHSFILNKNFFVPKAIIKPLQLTDTEATMLIDKQITMQRELEALKIKEEYLKGKPQFTTPVTATADGGDEAKEDADADAYSGDEAKEDADADADAYSGDEAKAYAEYARRARQNVSEWLLKNNQAGGKKKRTKRNKRVKSRRRIKGKSMRRHRK